MGGKRVNQKTITLKLLI